MEYFVFKLNLEPSILITYQYETQKDSLISVVVPKAFSKMFETYKELEGDKIEFTDFVDVEEIVNSEEYKKVKIINKQMIEKYREVLDDYKEGKGIAYSPEYLEKRTKLNNSIRALIDKYPILVNAEDITENVFPVRAFSAVKMAVVYIRRAKKIEYYLNNFPEDDMKSAFIYDKNEEYIYISTNGKTSEKAIEYANLLEQKINSFSAISNIGSVTINPVYKEVLFEGKYTEVTVELVYPNGDPARDRSRAIEAANAAREKTTFHASKKGKIDASKLSDYYKQEGEKGYIKGATSRGRNIIKSIIKTIRF